MTWRSKRALRDAPFCPSDRDVGPTTDLLVLLPYTGVSRLFLAPFTSVHDGDPMIHGQGEMRARLMQAEVVAAAAGVRSVEKAHVVARPGFATIDGEKYLNTACG